MRSIIVGLAAIILAAASSATAVAAPPAQRTDYGSVLDRIERMARAGATQGAIDRTLERRFGWVREPEDRVLEAFAAPSASDVTMAKPILYRNLPAHRYEVIARWAWRDCGTARCWAANYPLNDGPIGGPDGFAINSSRALTNLATSFVAYTEDGAARSFTNPEVFENDGVGFAEQDTSRTTDDDYDWDHGTLVFAFRLAGACVHGQQYKFSSNLAHTWADASLSGISISTAGIGMSFTGSAKRWTAVVPTPLYWTPC
jgi:hypothetical protein